MTVLPKSKNKPMLLLIDNYDSFTYNLVQYFGELQADVLVRRNNEIELTEIEHLPLSHIVISPGPGTPNDSGISLALIERYAGILPILGVCLGHQCIGQLFGGKVVPAQRLMHGKTSVVYHDKQGLFAGIPSPFSAMRYHSLTLQTPLPNTLQITAQTGQGEIMSVRHQEMPIAGVQFHPESILTTYGKQLLQNFLQSKSK